ncbi:Crp/Fnr family transcriptional regulator [Sphingomonas sp. TX0543]|uniref:Crp/Fnr family transcriptional regulator n=1 Tax=unclassified Sphingomonas TaxID=196159 RepID=UPI0014853E63|nr:Crp/Fnr family transcriptional regulator [Sphingomonas sp. 3P27F8]
MVTRDGQPGDALIHRLVGLADLGPADWWLVKQALDSSRRLPACADLGKFAAEGSAREKRLAILEGSAARVRVLANGRRQLIRLYVPGEMVVDVGDDSGDSLRAITPVSVCVMPDPATLEARSELALAYERARRLDDLYIFAQVVRLGSLDAADRLGHLLLELRERYYSAGLTNGDGMPLPLTQTDLGDLLGLTSVHVNRMLRSLRTDGFLTQRKGWIALQNDAKLAKRVGFVPATS